MELNELQAKNELIRTWWPERVIQGPHEMVGAWRKALDYEIHLLAEIAASDPDSFTVEERSGYGCQWGWTTKNWRLQDGTVDGKNTSVGCYSVGEDDAGPHFEIRTEQLRGLVVHLCREHFVEFFPKFAEAMGVEWQATASAEKRSEGGAL